MIQMGFQQAKAAFLTADAVTKQMDEKAQRALSRTGGYIRTVARRSMRRRKQSSNPGEPPSAHAGQLRDLYFFVWDGATRSVVAGPVLFSGAASAGQSPRVPELLEAGGTVTREDRRGRRRTARVLARPYSAPALATAVEKGVIANQFSDSFTGTIGG